MFQIYIAIIAALCGPCWIEEIDVIVLFILVLRSDGEQVPEKRPSYGDGGAMAGPCLTYSERTCL